jgi:hypothetical protein
MNSFFSKPLSHRSFNQATNLGIAHMMKHTFSIELKGQGTHCAIFLTIILGSISRLCSFLGLKILSNSKNILQ